MPNDSAGRPSSAEDYGYQGFHTYATSDLYDTNGGPERWPDNWAGVIPADRGGPSASPPPAPTKRDYWIAALWTVFWYAIPALILIIRVVTLSSAPDPVCVAAGLGDCASPRARAVTELLANTPLWLLSLIVGMVLAAVLRWASTGWRPITIGFCAAVVSGAAATLLYRLF